jgi:hypothetical protein
VTDKKDTGRPGFTQDGYSRNDGYNRREALHEGYIRKGGTNEGKSQIQTRPPAPAPMRPSNQAPTVTRTEGKDKS